MYLVSKAFQSNTINNINSDSNNMQRYPLFPPQCERHKISNSTEKSIKCHNFLHTHHKNGNQQHDQL